MVGHEITAVIERQICAGELSKESFPVTGVVVVLPMKFAIKVGF
jgi:hypothetical protein